MTTLTLTLERLPVYASTQPPAGRITTKEITIEEITRLHGHNDIVAFISWKRSDGSTQIGKLLPTGHIYATARGGRPLRYEVQEDVSHLFTFVVDAWAER